MVNERIYELADLVRNVEMTDAEREVQRMNFAYGNCHIENPSVTRQVVREAMRQLKEERGGTGLS